jgi:hypothetical protein
MVLQFAQTYFGSHDELVAFEDRLIARLPRTCVVDGHDTGSGTTNFFVFTDAPMAAHKRLRRSFTRALERNLRVAYRSVAGSAFTNLWPFRDPRPFALIYEPEDDPFRPASKRQIPKRSKPGVSKFATPAALPKKKKRAKK